MKSDFFGDICARQRLTCLVVVMLVSLLALGCTSASLTSSHTATNSEQYPATRLPDPKLGGGTSLEEALFKRRSVRDYSPEPLTLEEVSQLLWAAQGVTTEMGGRTAPSAGALYPLEIYLIAGNVDGLSVGVYRYNPERHELAKVKDGDTRGQLSAAVLDQSCVKEGAVSIIITAVYERTTAKYGERGVRYVYMEAGHAAQNICLQATALDLGAVTVGAFHDDLIKEKVGLSENEFPLYVIPVGRKKN